MIKVSQGHKSRSVNKGEAPQRRCCRMKTGGIRGHPTPSLGQKTSMYKLCCAPRLFQSSAGLTSSVCLREKVIVCTCTLPPAAHLCLQTQTHPTSLRQTPVWIGASAATGEGVSVRQSCRFIYSAVLRIDGSFILLPSRTEAWSPSCKASICSLCTAQRKQTHSEANPDRTTLCHSFISLWRVSLTPLRLSSAATIVSTLNPSHGTPRKNFLDDALFCIPVWALQAGGLRCIGQTRHGAAQIQLEKERERERRGGGSGHQLFMWVHSKLKTPPCYYNVNAVKSADLGDLRRGDLRDFQEVKQPQVMSDQGALKILSPPAQKLFQPLDYRAKVQPGPTGTHLKSWEVKYLWVTIDRACGLRISLH